MERKTSDPAQAGQVKAAKAESVTSSPGVALLQLPGGLLYFHDLQEMLPAREGANLRDLQARQPSVPLLSARTQAVVAVLNKEKKVHEVKQEGLCGTSSRWRRY